MKDEKHLYYDYIAGYFTDGWYFKNENEKSRYWVVDNKYNQNMLSLESSSCNDENYFYHYLDTTPPPSLPPDDK
ncbi:hypothetical protein [Candidatus Phytoplasma pruni]|uniref:Uncharacterized protein n=1 Tax=Candidatus Phytoplasma pruni TaxID=479893 RepID=A0A851HAT5_9MOLU|nr:hypothetical protein [Candidatus Phytoplasma pruni]NWN46072.1 hypothetical protein [Candidatus Phytoplasma pruni]